MKLIIRNFVAKSGTFSTSLPSLVIGPGEIACVMGKSGSGKTTLLNAIAGFLPSTGSLQFGDLALESLPPEGRRIGFVFQRGALFPNYTVAGNVDFGLRTQKVKRAERAVRVQRWLEKLNIGALADRYPSQISEGQAQRAAIARALAVEFPILLLDEPFSALDRETRLHLREGLLSLVREQGVRAIMVSHDSEDAAFLGTSLTVIEDGKVVWQGAPGERTET